MSSTSPKKPLAPTNPNSSTLNQSNLVSEVPVSVGHGGSLDPLLSGNLPPQKVFPVHQPGESSRQLAQAVLQYGNEPPADVFGRDGLVQDYAAEPLASDPHLSSNFNLGNQSAEG
ncbi:uncharacterized protein DFL_001891 [Arthrobotrys flagrans]|uniref:Uncharacterized protein n=1 Tax=Arthrobotrys flagrans TaxID=97331 RepID=A0A437A8Y9_ARTFL|nr:hypothetical protein DFL_001891 [Arthrobotrys flagrans]